MEIANIVAEQEINVGPEFNVVKSMDEIIFKDLPTLIIGYELSCLFFEKDLINVLNKKINKDTFWTFNRIVKRDVYSNDLENFIRYSYKKYLEKINYVDLDLIQNSNKKNIKIIRKIYELDNIITYKSINNVFYLYSNNIIFGIDLNLVEFVGINPEKAKNKIIEKSKVFLEGEEILIEYNNHLERLNHDIKYVPFLFSIKPNE